MGGGRAWAWRGRGGGINNAGNNFASRGVARRRRGSAWPAWQGRQATAIPTLGQIVTSSILQMLTLISSSPNLILQGSQLRFYIYVIDISSY